MEELSFGELLTEAGRSDFIGNYHSDEYGQSDLKHAQRLKVLRYILSFWPESRMGFVKLLSFPGLNWTFENMLRLERPFANFLGLEHSRSAYMKSRLAIPFSELSPTISHDSHIQDRSIPYGRGEIFYSRKRAQKKYRSGTKRGTRSHRLLLMDMHTYATMLFTDYGSSVHERKIFFEKFYQRNAAWLDFTGPITHKLEDILRHMPICFYDGDNPLVITILNGRDRFHSVQERLDFLAKAQPDYIIQDHDVYIGKGGVSMLTVYGFIRNA